MTPPFIDYYFFVFIFILFLFYLYLLYYLLHFLIYYIVWEANVQVLSWGYAEDLTDCLPQPRLGCLKGTHNLSLLVFVFSNAVSISFPGIQRTNDSFCLK